MRRMTWGHWHDFALLGAGLLLVGLIGAGYPGPQRPLYRALLALVTVAALFAAVYFLALWRSR
jgi:hypothetical protein